MVHFWMLEGELHASAAAGPSAASAEAARFAEESDAKGMRYRDFCCEAIEGGLTPVFSWSGGRRDAHAAPRLVLLALRHMSSGLYVPHQGLAQLAAPYGVPIVVRLATWSPPRDITLAGAIAQLHELAARRGAELAKQRMVREGGKGRLGHARGALPRRGQRGGDEGCVIMCENGYLLKTGHFEARPRPTSPPRGADPTQAVR